MENPSVFISYSWDSEDHKAWVLELADELRGNGVDARLDQYGNQVGENWPYWIEKNLREVDKVLLILTEKYKTKAEDRDGGVGLEYGLILDDWRRNQKNNLRYFPVLKSGSEETSIPNFVKSYVRVDMRQASSYKDSFNDILRAIYSEPKIPKPALGEVPNIGLINDSEDVNHSGPNYLTIIPHAPSIFIGRDEKLNEIKESLNSEPHIYNLKGIPGIGKTSIARKYINQHKNNYKNIAWIEFNQDHNLNTS